jgi:hypothetical protein
LAGLEHDEKIRFRGQGIFAATISKAWQDAMRAKPVL